MEALKQALHEAVFKSGRPAKAIAAEVGVNYNYLARMVLPGHAGCNFPVHLLVPVMQATRNYGALKQAAHECGFLLVEHPPALTPVDARQVLPDFLKSYSRTVEAVLEWLDTPGETREQLADALLKSHMETVEKMRLCVSGASGFPASGAQPPKK